MREGGRDEEKKCRKNIWRVKSSRESRAEPQRGATLRQEGGRQPNDLTGTLRWQILCNNFTGRHLGFYRLFFEVRKFIKNIKHHRRHHHQRVRIPHHHINLLILECFPLSFWYLALDLLHIRRSPMMSFVLLTLAVLLKVSLFSFVCKKMLSVLHKMLTH